MTAELELPLDDHVQKAKFYNDRDGHYSGMSFHIKKSYTVKGVTNVWFCSRYYATYDKPDWEYFFKVNEKEADDIVRAGYASYWFKREDIWGVNGKTV